MKTTFETNGNVIEAKERFNKKNYFLVVSSENGGCVLECWADNYTALLGIVNIYDDKEQPYKVDMIVDVKNAHIYQIDRHK